MHTRFKIVTAVWLFAVCGVAAGQSKADLSLQKERSNLARASDPVDRAKIEVRMSDLLVTLLTDAARTGNAKLVEQHLNDYASTIQDAHQTLMKTGKDARKHSAGFKDLEIALRKQQRRLVDAGRLLDFDEREPVERVRKLASDIDDQLVKAMLLKDPNAPRKR